MGRHGPHYNVASSGSDDSQPPSEADLHLHPFPPPTPDGPARPTLQCSVVRAGRFLSPERSGPTLSPYPSCQAPMGRDGPHYNSSAVHVGRCPSPRCKGPEVCLHNCL